MDEKIRKIFLNEAAKVLRNSFDSETVIFHRNKIEEVIVEGKGISGVEDYLQKLHLRSNDDIERILGYWPDREENELRKRQGRV